MRRVPVLAALVMFGLIAGVARHTPAQQVKEGGPAVTDEQFAMKASEIDLAEINLGNLAMQTASSAEVKQFAKKMVTDHGMSSKEMLTIANKKGLKLAMTMDAKHQALAEQLSKVQGKEFDKVYMQHMVK